MGYIYLLQPAELVGTDRFKIGVSSKNNLNRLRSYGCGTRYIFFMECDNFFSLENSLKRAFGLEKGIRLIKGKEYFEGDEAVILKTFMEVLWKEKLEKIVHSDSNINNEYVDKYIEAQTDVIMHDVILVDSDTDDSEDKKDSIISFGETINKFKFRK